MSLKLIDYGDVVLIDNSHVGYLWESFNHPINTFLNGMTFHENLTLTSWKNESDQGSGSFIFQ